jgi:hypothetical protein
MCENYYSYTNYVCMLLHINFNIVLETIFKNFVAHVFIYENCALF